MSSGGSGATSILSAINRNRANGLNGSKAANARPDDDERELTPTPRKRPSGGKKTPAAGGNGPKAGAAAHTPNRPSAASVLSGPGAALSAPKTGISVFTAPAAPSEGEVLDVVDAEPERVVKLTLFPESYKRLREIDAWLQEQIRAKRLPRPGTRVGNGLVMQLGMELILIAAESNRDALLAVARSVIETRQKEQAGVATDETDG
jgi:hypothetical protein